jgi:drug/metabolite transporter (DMT)-like permease
MTSPLSPAGIGAPPPQLLAGTLFALAAGLTWGLVFVAPLLLPDTPPALLSVGRYLAFGLIALPLAWWDRRELARLTREDWLAALGLALVGNLLYYLFLAASIQRAGGALPTMIIGTLPVVIAIVSNLRGGGHGPGASRLAWRRLLPSLALIAAGLALVNHAELAALAHSAQAADPAARTRYAVGAALALGAVVCWTWYPIRNADWLRRHPDRSPRAWATAQGVATLPLALLGYALVGVWGAQQGPTVAWPFGPDPVRFVMLMCALGLFASWLGTLCWNEASQRLPTTLAGQLIVFETLAALAFVFALRGHWPEPQVALGIAVLVAGVAWAVRVAAGSPTPAVQAQVQAQEGAAAAARNAASR